MKNKCIWEIIAHSGDNINWLITAFILLGLGWLFKDEIFFNFGIVIIAASLIGSLISSIMKMIFKKERPIGDRYKEYAFWARFDMGSFPSGHLTRLTATVTGLGYLFPGTLAITILYLALVFYSRKILGYHYLSDLIGGIFTGIFCGVILIFLNFKFKFII